MKNRNNLIGAGIIIGGLILAYRAKQRGKVVPIIGRFIPSAPVAAPAAPAEQSSFNGRHNIAVRRSWDT